MHELVIQDFEVMEKILNSRDGKLYIYKDDSSMDRLDELWDQGYLFRSVSWFNKDYCYQLTKSGERLLTVRIG